MWLSMTQNLYHYMKPDVIVSGNGVYHYFQYTHLIAFCENIYCFICLFIYLRIYVFNYVFIYLFICLSIYLFIYLCTYLLFIY